MIEIEVPGFATFRFQHLVLDANGTISLDGRLMEGVPELIKELRSKLDIHLVTADTQGTQEIIDRVLNLAAVRIAKQNQIQAKLDYVAKLGADAVVAIGNGANDAGMLEHAALGIAIIGPEGASVGALCKADIVVPHIRAAFELLLFPKRLIATLRR
ncbi:MAG: HAD hydrolase family protein [Acidobacteria bacterium]|nr:HAD hydrolase family protein [Acidobacteriota bacterium]